MKSSGFKIKQEDIKNKTLKLKKKSQDRLFKQSLLKEET